MPDRRWLHHLLPQCQGSQSRALVNMLHLAVVSGLHNNLPPHGTSACRRRCGRTWRRRPRARPWASSSSTAETSRTRHRQQATGALPSCFTLWACPHHMVANFLTLSLVHSRPLDAGGKENVCMKCARKVCCTGSARCAVPAEQVPAAQVAGGLPDPHQLGHRAHSGVLPSRPPRHAGMWNFHCRCPHTECTAKLCVCTSSAGHRASQQNMSSPV